MVRFTLTFNQGVRSSSLRWITITNQTEPMANRCHGFGLILAGITEILTLSDQVYDIRHLFD